MNDLLEVALKRTDDQYRTIAQAFRAIYEEVASDPFVSRCVPLTAAYVDRRVGTSATAGITGACRVVIGALRGVDVDDVELGAAVELLVRFEGRDQAGCAWLLLNPREAVVYVAERHEFRGVLDDIAGDVRVGDAQLRDPAIVEQVRTSPVMAAAVTKFICESDELKVLIPELVEIVAVLPMVLKWHIVRR